MADHIESTFEIGIQDCVKILFLHHGKQAVPGNACIIDKNLCSTEISPDLCDSFFNRGKISHIALISPGFNTVFLSAFRADTLSSCCIPCKNNSCIGTHRRQFINDRFSDPPGAAGHNRCFPIQHLFIAAQHSSTSAQHPSTSASFSAGYSARDSARYSLTFTAFTSLLIFLIILVSVLPGPISIKVSTPAAIILRMIVSHCTGLQI